LCFAVIISNFWTIISFLQKLLSKGLMRIVFLKRALWSQTVVYQILISCLTWSKQLKLSQKALLSQKIIATKTPPLS